MPAASQRSRTTVFVVICLVCVLLALEAGSFAVIVLTARVTEEEIRRTADIYEEQSLKIRKLLDPGPKLLQLDPELGWRYRAGYRDSRDRMNALGVRSAREYSVVPGPGVVRVAAFGDSFVYCNEVANNDSWPTLMESLSPRIEVLNYGVGGYGTDQAFLRYMREGPSSSPDVVIIGFAPDDLRRVINVYRRFISNRELPLVKPRFVLESGGRLVLVPNPLPQPSDYEKYLRQPASIIELGRHDQLYQPAVYENPLFDYSATVRVLVTVATRIYSRYVDADRLFSGNLFSRSSTAFKIQAALLEKFSSAVQASGAMPIVVIFPDRDSVVEGRRGRPKIFDPLVDHLRRRGITVADLTDAFVAEDGRFDIAEWFMPGGHYSPLANRHVASRLGQYIGAMVSAKR